MKYFLLIAFFCVGSDFLFSNEFAEIYFTHWHLDRRAALTEEMVRGRPDIYIKINSRSEIDRLRRLLKDSSLEIIDGVGEHVDIVIDFINNDNTTTYIINRFGFLEKGENIFYKTPEVLLMRYSLIEFEMLTN